MSKKIKFGSDLGYLITDMTLKQNMINYLYSSLNLSKYRFTMLNSINGLDHLRDNEHYVMPNFKGFNYLLIFTKLNGSKYCVALDRRKLSYHKNQVDLKLVFMIKLNISTSEQMYEGTIFDGKIVETSNKHIFLIQDCFYLMGKSMLDIELKEKIINLDTIIKTSFSNACVNFTFKLNKIYEYNELEELIKTVIPSCSHPIQGLIFYPKYSGISIIHIEKVENKITIETTQTTNIEYKSYNLIADYLTFLKSRTYSYEKGNKLRKLYLSKSNIPDVYNISEKSDSEKIGIAHIPSLKISHLCLETIKDNYPIKFNCVYDTKFKKWIPISVA